MSVEDIYKLAFDLGKLANVPREVAQQGADAIKGELVAEFRNGVNPYGRVWARLKPSTLKRGRRPPPLTDKGDMLESLDVRPNGTGIEGHMGGPSAFHQRGTRKMAARQIFPEATLPPAWDKALVGVTERTVKTALGE